MFLDIRDDAIEQSPPTGQFPYVYLLFTPSTPALAKPQSYFNLTSAPPLTSVLASVRFHVSPLKPGAIFHSQSISLFYPILLTATL
jgi:hypothetical protein